MTPGADPLQDSLDASILWAAVFLVGVIADRTFQRFVERRRAFDIAFTVIEDARGYGMKFDVTNRSWAQWPELELALITPVSDPLVVRATPAGSSALAPGQTCSFIFHPPVGLNKVLEPHFPAGTDTKLAIRVARSRRTLFSSRRMGLRLGEIVLAGRHDNGMFDLGRYDYEIFSYHCWKPKWLPFLWS